jgi:hypothetical protein
VLLPIVAEYAAATIEDMSADELGVENEQWHEPTKMRWRPFEALFGCMRKKAKL